MCSGVKVKSQQSELVFAKALIIPLANFVCGGVYCSHVVRPSVCPSATLSFFPNILKTDNVSAVTLISIRCTYTRESKGYGPILLEIALCEIS